MIVAADEQTEARGQMGTKWLSEEGKNLTFSMFVSMEYFPVSRQFELNQAISLGLLKALKKYMPNSKIKWPNDILADTKKIAGMLIENSVSKNYLKHSIVGIGLNVNQTDFPEEIPNASSLKLLRQRDFDLDLLLSEITDSIKSYIADIEAKKNDELKKEYLHNLYLYNRKATFYNKKNERFAGRIIGISDEGQLLLKLQSTEIVAFDHKEIQFLT